jgi:hypothetical protein
LHITSKQPQQKELEMKNFAEMGKSELRQACRDAGIPYGKLNNDGMRAALEAAQLSEQANEDADPTGQNSGAPEVEPEKNIWDVARDEAKAKVASGTVDFNKLGEAGVVVLVDEGNGATEQGFCPHCFSHESNGFCDSQHVYDGGSKESHEAAYEMKRQFTCLGCNGEWGPVNPLIKKVQAPVQNPGTGLKIEKNRETKNGVTRPSIGGACRDVWDALDAIVAEGGKPTAKDVRGLAQHEGWNINNALIEFYQWRKFNGITGRQ